MLKKSFSALKSVLEDIEQNLAVEILEKCVVMYSNGNYSQWR